MKLMSPSEVKDAGNSETTRQILRAKEAQEMTEKWSKSLARAEADFASASARRLEEWAKGEEEHSKRVKEMADEVEKLEARKAQALIPVEVYKQEAEEKMKKAEKIISDYEEKEEDLEETKELLQDKLDDVGEREIDVTERENKCKLREKGIDEQSEQLKLGIKKLSDSMLSFQSYMKTEEAKLNEKRKEIKLKEINMGAREDKYQRDLKALADYDSKLKDERGVLDRGFKELREKTISK